MGRLPSGKSKEIGRACCHFPADTHAAVLTSLWVFNGSLLIVTDVVGSEVGVFQCVLVYFFISLSTDGTP